MKKTALLLVVMLVVSIFALSSCDLLGKIPGLGDLIGGDKPCEEHVDENGDYICDKCQAELENNDTPDDPTCEHKDENKDHSCDLCEEKLSDCAAADGSHECSVCGKKLSECEAEANSHNCKVCGKKLSDHNVAADSHSCSICGAALTECEDTDKNHKCDVCGTDVGEHKAADGSHNCGYCGVALSECEDADTNHKCDVCGTEMGEHKEATGSHACGYCGQVISECVDADSDYACDICGKDELPENLERVTYSLVVGDEFEAGKQETDLFSGKFVIVANTEIRNRTKKFTDPDTGLVTEYIRSVKFGSNGNAIKVDVPGTGKLSFIIQNGSSGAATQFVTVTAPDGTVYDIEFAGTDEGSPLVKITVDVTAGEWTIGRGKNGGTQDIYALDLSCIVEKSDENGFELVSAGNVDYLCGQKLDTSGLKLNATYKNGKTEPLALSDVIIDTSAVNLAVSGTYPITIKYKEYTPITVAINVYMPESVTLGLDAIKQNGQSAAGNGVYFNYSFKEVYSVGDTLDLSGLSVLVNGILADSKKTFNVGSAYEMSEVDLSTAGAKTITISYVFGESRVSATIDVHVTDVTPAPNEDGVILTLVDPNYEGARGALSGEYYCFSTIQQALDFLAKADAGTPKEILIREGLYNEKLEITIPNLKICGEGADKTIIEWDSLFGLRDAGGFVHTTDSTATVAIRDSAVNCVIEDLTISNYWNSQERMDEANLGIERGLALLVQADRFIMRNSKLLGIQDTLELFTGRQYFENVFISGYTDFIFGTNNTTLFKGCTIHVIDTVKNTSGTAGYLTAFKGSNKGASDAITYGAIFYQCKFTADEGIMEGKTAIGRTWGAYAAVAIIESELGGHISLDGYVSSENKNKRYISMNGIHPTDDTVQFVEYNNTGAGAITEPVAGMKMLTAEEAALYIDIATIFGKINRGVSWLDPWDPAVTEIVEDDRTYYYFDQTVGTSGTSNTFDINTTIASGSTLEWAGLLISAENGKVAWNSNANSLNMKAGAFIKFTVPAGTEVTVITYPNYNYFTLNGVATASSTTLSQYYTEETEVVLLSTGDLYIYQIIINPDEEAPAAPDLSEIKASGMNTNYNVGDELSLEGLVVKATYSDNSVIEITDYIVDSSAVVNTAAGEYVVVISFGGKTASVTVIYEDPNADPAITKDTVLDFTTVEGLESVQNNPKVTIEGSVRHNGGEIQITGTISFKIKAGTVITVIPYANTQYASFKIYAEGKQDDITYNETQSVMFFEDCTVVYEGLENNYLCKIFVECPLGEGKYVFGGSTIEGDVTGILESIPSMSVSGTCKTHSGGAQLGSDSQIIFICPALATVTIQGFDTNYGQLLVLVDGVPVEMNDKAQYVINATYPATVIIEAVNVGTEAEPAWNKSYITYIEVDLPVYVEENTEITFGSEGNYKDSVVDFSGITIGDNGGNNSQIKNGSFSFAVRKGAIVTVHGYNGYTSYNLGDGELVYKGITDEFFNYEAWSDCVITISHTEGNNYFYSISVVYPVVFEENTTIDLSATNGLKVEGSTANYEGLEIDATNGKFADNGSGWVQINAGTVIKLNVLDGAEVSAKTYQNAEIFTIEIVEGVCTLTCTANGYVGAITVNYPIVYDEATTIDLSATNGTKIEGSVGVYEGLTVDATSGKFADNGSGWVQINAGTIITLSVAEGASVTAKTYQDAEIFTIEIVDGVCTLTCTANGYIGAINVAY